MTEPERLVHWRGLDSQEVFEFSGIHRPTRCGLFDEVADALLAVLELHAAPDQALPGEIHCGELIDWVQGGCPTVRVIAEKLGIEAVDVR